MKKIVLSIIFVLISIICFSQEKGESILKTGYEIYGAVKQMLVPIMHENTGNLIGFARCYGEGGIVLEPQFEDLFYDGNLLVPVKKNGKWGMVDMAMRNGKILVMPCEYNSKDAVVSAYKRKVES